MGVLEIRMPAPAEWPRLPLREACELISRGRAPTYVDHSEVMAIGQRCIRERGFVADEARPHDAHVMGSALVAMVGDVLLNSTGTGTIGRSCVFDSQGKFIVDGHVTVLRPKREVATSEWLNCILGSHYGQQHLETFCYSGSTNQIELSRSRLCEAALPLPPLAEQRQIAKVLDTLNETIRQAQAVLEKLSLVRLGLVHDVLTGVSTKTASCGSLRATQNTS